MGCLEGGAGGGRVDLGQFCGIQKAPYAAVGTINAAIAALAKAFSDRGLKDGVQVNSVLPGPVIASRRKSPNSWPFWSRRGRVG
jgi:NAD(P)-dependent dehydrogenase (short-subunit alcohol dehydrogenase family)